VLDIPNLKVISTVTPGQEKGGPNTEAKNDPKLAKVLVLIPASYCDKVSKQHNPAKAGEPSQDPHQAVIEKIREEVVMLLPPDLKDPASLVTVAAFPDIKAAETPDPPATQWTLTWLGQNWPIVAVAGLVLVGLGMLRSIGAGRVGRGGQEPFAETNRRSAPTPQVPRTNGSRPVSPAGTGPSLRDELSELVQEDPNSAANILRDWIGQGSS
jgi:flagellar M-ring protein FliF